MKNTIAAAGMLVLVFACAKSEQPTANTKPNPAAPATVRSAAAPSVAPASNLLTGTIAETFDGGGYTYLRIATATGDQWAAVPAAQVKKGDAIAVAAQMTMEKFESKTLNRTFDTIVFGSIATPGETPAAAPAQAQAQMPTGHPPTTGKMPTKMPPQMASALAATASQHMKAPDAGDLQVEKPQDGKAVAELWSQRAALSGKPIIVRGKVVKFLGGIMGKNWLHIQDGTGSSEKGDNDITVTTTEQATVGSIVTVRGTLVTDKDFGAGYRYDVIIENAKLE